MWTSPQIDTARWALHIIQALEGRWYGNYGTCLCPVHNDRQPSLSVRAGETTVLVKCHAGCEAEDVIRALRKLELWPNSEGPKTPNSYPTSNYPSATTNYHAVTWLWDQAQSIRSTLGERYLSNRYFTHIASPELRFLPDAKHGPSSQKLPCLVAAVRDHRGVLQGLHRTFLHPTSADKADLPDCRLWLGQCRANAIHLGQPKDGLLGIAEGLETADSASRLYSVPVWAALSASNLSTTLLPKNVERIVIFADNDAPGRKAASAAMSSYTAEGRKCRVVFPAANYNDFNDVVLARARSISFPDD